MPMGPLARFGPAALNPRLLPALRTVQQHIPQIQFLSGLAAGCSAPTPLDRFAYMGFVAVGNSEAEGLRRAELVKSYLETNTRVAEPYKNPPGFMAAAEAAKLFPRAGGRGAAPRQGPTAGQRHERVA